jgi:hypothetical protein
MKKGNEGHTGVDVEDGGCDVVWFCRCVGMTEAEPWETVWAWTEG